MYRVDTKALRVAMAEKGIATVSQLSDMTGITRTTLYNVLNGKVMPSANTMCRLAETLELGNKAGTIFFAKKLTESVSK